MVFTCLSPRDLAIASLVCKMWKPLAYAEQDKYKKAGCYLILDILRQLIPFNEHGEALFYGLEEILNLNMPMVIGEDLLFYRKAHKKETKKVSLGNKLLLPALKIYNSCMKVFQKENFKTQIKNFLETFDNDLVISKEAVCYILSSSSIIVDQYYKFALKNLEIPQRIAYAKCENFNDLLLECSKKHNLYFISKDICLNGVDFENLKKSLSDSSGNDFYIYPADDDKNTDFCVMEKFFQLFNSQNVPFSLSLIGGSVYLTDRDVPYLIKLIERNQWLIPAKKTNQYCLSECKIHYGNQITTAGLRLFANLFKELREKIPYFEFEFTAIRGAHNSEGLDLLKSLEEQTPRWSVYIKIEENLQTGS